MESQYQPQPQQKDFFTEEAEYQNKNKETGNGIARGLSWPRSFGYGDPYEHIEWDVRNAKIAKHTGEVVFEQKNVEVPSFWSQTATDIVASKYFRGRLDSPERERSARQMVDRVVNTISDWGWRDGYFATREDNENFRQDLKYILINQYGSFNSPVWFNVGVYEKPQCSACFILKVEDTMESILEWYETEGWIFKGGSGSGLDISSLRSSKEALSKGGYSSGPVSFMKGADGVANSIRSGGTTRRAAKMVVLKVDHPDIKSFIYSKKIIEDMSKMLVKAGVENSIEGNMFDPYTLLPYQNANNSVRVTDEFMHAVENDDDWELKAITSGEILETVKAREVMNWIADAAWHSADPGMQYHTTINNWHTCPNSGPITASNPCSEYMHIDNSACNLASINLIKFLNADGTFNVDGYKKVIDTFITAQEILVGNSSYPTKKIEKNAQDYRQLGLGYTNLGALLMNMGYAYDSEEGRAVGGAVTSILSGRAYLMSSKIAAIAGPFAGYEMNREPMLNVIKMHKDSAEDLGRDIHERSLLRDFELSGESVRAWHEALTYGEKYGYRNAQATVIAPTGTISFMMDADTTGIEPELALVKYKKLVGGGMIKLVNRHVPSALKKLGYSDDQIQEISDYVVEKDTIEGAPGLKSEHFPVFDCSFKAVNGHRSISHHGHLKMMAAAQPFVSGAISKTVNLPKDATVDDIKDCYIEAWKLGLKAVAVYRDGCKGVQPMSTSKDADLVEKVNGYTRIKLPDERPSITHKFSVGNHQGYLTVGFYPGTNKPGETFITMAKEGSTISGLFDTIATLTSMCLQSGIPLKTLVKKFRGLRFEPMGATTNNNLPFAKSFVDYVFTYLGMNFLNDKDRDEIFGPGHNSAGSSLPNMESNDEDDDSKNSLKIKTSKDNKIMVQLASINISEGDSDAPLCECGTLMVKAGSCYSCPNCFSTTGSCQ
ncbi:MAG: ribonucleoside-diphosphate reductase, adenosylcobalamin-dependent [Candidatus Yanofskybacteria bacterium CG10_big_fil_rev_8_21_14_0_10_36_16]|uniref:Vitamin B12-dependent ribonucleotide reductase n=1 Tax=Candidatus Yanofskybacteria bacterium CG10_big_fil_rev_8_21_14_0_10_36_16 TaxID=1975096 RepID=A0A2J0Q853_9BACT|nr:MAG: ribonucleoside-diphosphate reductase, adenosylcobalamin-dependent [Candidatus Yanofskybacteria bacterium CG10_big_fil_rev_8_21_14_0_10_36_16]